MDTRGHGRSPRGGAPFTLLQFADDLAAFMDALGLARAHLLGFSDGANIAMLFALKNPARVGKLVLNGGNLRPSGVRPAMQLPIVLGYGLCAVLSKFDRRAVPKRELLGLMVKGAEAPAVRPRGALHARARRRRRSRHDPPQPHRANRPRPAKRRAGPPAGDHFVARGNPEAFNRAVLEFLLEN